MGQLTDVAPRARVTPSGAWKVISTGLQISAFGLKSKKRSLKMQIILTIGKIESRVPRLSTVTPMVRMRGQEREPAKRLRRGR